MNTISAEELSILYKLWRHRCFGKGHMLLDNLIDGFPTNAQPIIQKATETLIRNGCLVKKPTKHGYAVYINLNYRLFIEQELRKKYPFL
jgi:hypothetical protein